MAAAAATKRKDRDNERAMNNKKSRSDDNCFTDKESVAVELRDLQVFFFFDRWLLLRSTARADLGEDGGGGECWLWRGWRCRTENLVDMGQK